MVKRYKKKDPHAKREAKNYDKPVPSRELILNYLEEIDRPVSFEHLLASFAITDADEEEGLRRRVIAMLRDGQLARGKNHRLALPSQLDMLKGRVIGHKDGFGFVAVEDGQGDLFLSPSQMRRVFDGDYVLAHVVGTDRRGRREGHVINVIERANQKLAGRYFEKSGVSHLVPDNHRIPHEVIVPPQERGQARDGQLVVVELITYPEKHRQATGRVIEILGDHMAPGLEIDLAIYSHDIPSTWDDAVTAQANAIPDEVHEKDTEGAKDLRALPLVTIDGKDAKDFDDAVFCERNKKGGWTLYVAIADVSHYVRPGTPLDEEAVKRGNSVYFPGRVIPMLPHKLSDGLCSLRPNVDRLAVVCEMNIDKTGGLKDFTFYRAVICSHARLTYSQVAGLFEGEEKGLSELKPHLLELHALYKVLHVQRKKRGAMDFDTTETRIVFGKQRKIKCIIPVYRNDAHRLIEECMLLANISAARFLQKKKMLALMRVHEGPDSNKLETLREFLSGLGLRLGGGKEPEAKDYGKVLDLIQGRPDAHLIQTVLLRSMAQAIYTPEYGPHFGLAFDVYCHFTSPIRRYPDLLVHRAILHAVTGGSMKNFEYDMPRLARSGEHCSMTERRADHAVRDAEDWLKCEYMLDKLGEAFEGVITSVTGFGFFVELKDIFVEGLVHINSLDNDHYQFDSVNHCLQGKRTRARFQLGDVVQVRVAKVDLDDRKIDFSLNS